MKQQKFLKTANFTLVETFGQQTPETILAKAKEFMKNTASDYDFFEPVLQVYHRKSNNEDACIWVTVIQHKINRHCEFICYYPAKDKIVHCSENPAYRDVRCGELFKTVFGAAKVRLLDNLYSLVIRNCRYVVAS